MSDLARLSLSLEKPLLRQLERMLRSTRARNRSEFIRDLLRNHMVREEWEKDREVVGTITLVYDHDARELTARLTRLQHRRHAAILATTHVHLDRRLCVEMILAKGPASHIREIADLLRQQKGVLHTALSMSSTGRGLT